MMCIRIAADHDRFEMKVELTSALKAFGYEVADFGADSRLSQQDHRA